MNKGCAFAVRVLVHRVIATGIDPICALQSCMEGFEVADIESVVGEVDFLTSATGNFDVITLAHMKKMRIDAIVGKSVTSTTKAP